MSSPDAVVSRIADADPARHAGPAGVEQRALASRVRGRVLAEPAPGPGVHRSGHVFGGLVATVGSALVVIAVVGLVLVGHHGGGSAPGTGLGVAPAAGGESVTFAALARARTGQDRIPPPLAVALGREPHPLARLELGRSALVLTTAARRLWLVPAGRELCFVDLKVIPGRPAGVGGFSQGCIGREYADSRGLQLGVARQSFAIVLPQGTSPVTITSAHGPALQLHPDGNGVISRGFARPIRLITYTGPSGIRVRLRPAARAHLPPPS